MKSPKQLREARYTAAKNRCDRGLPPYDIEQSYACPNCMDMGMFPKMYWSDLKWNCDSCGLRVYPDTLIEIDRLGYDEYLGQRKKG